jgi:hypothetical protein
MSTKLFPFEVHSYFRFHGPIKSPVIARYFVTNQIGTAIDILFELVQNEKIRTIRILENKKVIISVTRKKDGWVSDL